MQDRLKTFWFLESIGVLFWIYMYLIWNLSFEPILFMIKPLAGLAVFFNFISLVYALTVKLDRRLVPLVAIIAGNLWVIADSLWAVYDNDAPDIYMRASNVFTVLLVFIATWEFIASKDNKATFAQLFGKFKRS